MVFPDFLFMAILWSPEISIQQGSKVIIFAKLFFVYIISSLCLYIPSVLWYHRVGLGKIHFYKNIYVHICMTTWNVRIGMHTNVPKIAALRISFPVAPKQTEGPKQTEIRSRNVRDSSQLCRNQSRGRAIGCPPPLLSTQRNKNWQAEMH